MDNREECLGTHSGQQRRMGIHWGQQVGVHGDTLGKTGRSAWGHTGDTIGQGHTGEIREELGNLATIGSNGDTLWTIVRKWEHTGTT